MCLYLMKVKCSSITLRDGCIRRLHAQPKKLRYVVVAEIYLLQFPSGKNYVGRTKSTAICRFRAHIIASRKLSNRTAVACAIRKYGSDSVKIKILVQGLGWEDSAIVEINWIKKLGTLASGGYNLTAGGEGLLNWAPSEATRTKWRKNCRRPKSPEHRDHMAQANRCHKKIETQRKAVKGRPKSKEHRRKLAAQCGWKHTEEAK